MIKSDPIFVIYRILKKKNGSLRSHENLRKGNGFWRLAKTAQTFLLLKISSSAVKISSKAAAQGVLKNKLF